MSDDVGSVNMFALQNLRGIFEDPSAAAHKVISGRGAVPEDTLVVSDEVIQNALLWIKIFEARGEAIPLSETQLALIYELAQRRGILGHDADADIAITEAIGVFYKIVEDLQAADPHIELLQTIADVETQLAAMEAKLTQGQRALATQLKINLADERSKILSLLGNETAAETAFLELLDLAAACDQRADTNYHRRMLVKFCDWLSTNNADETLRWMLPVVMEDLGATAPNVDSITLHTMLAGFFNRYADRMETDLHLERVKAVLGELGLATFSLEHLDETLRQWNNAIYAQDTRGDERFRLLNQALIAHYFIAALAYQSPNGTEGDNERMQSIGAFIGDMHAFEHRVKQDDAAYLAQMGEGVESAQVSHDFDPRVEDYREFTALMNATEGDDPPEADQMKLLEYCRLDELDPGLRAHALMRLGYVSLNSENYPAALTHFGFAEAVGRDHRIEDVQIEALKGMSTAQFMLGEFEQSSAIAGAAVERVEAIRETLTAPYLASAFLADKFQLYVLAINAARRLGDLETMQARIELIKARALQQAPGAIDVEERELTRQTLIKMRHEAAAFRADDPRRDRVLYKRRAAWEAMSLSRRAALPPFDLSRFQARLDSATAAISYFFFAPSILLVTVITADHMQTERIAIEDEDGFFRDIARLQNAHHGALGISGCLRRLAKVVLPEALDPYISASDQLIICAHQALHSVPFAALPWQGDPLIQDKTVGMVPNLTCLNQENCSSKADGVFAMAIRDTVVLPERPLDHAEAEAKTAIDIWKAASKPAVLLSGSELTLDGVHAVDRQNALRTAAVVHIGTHGSDVNEADAMRAPMEAHLCLYDASLDGMEISTFELNADVVILAACHAGKRAISARGLKTLPADAVFGLQSALHTAGAKSIIGAMWIVDDETTATITKHLHQALARGVRPVHALRLAVNTFREHANLIESDPSYWAAYTAVAFGPGAFELNILERNKL